MNTERCAGIDGCRGGWVAATRDGVYVAATLAPLLDALELDVVAIDMPIGLPEHRRRVCDGQARRMLKPHRHSSVFWTPTRPAVYAPTHDAATAVNRQRGAGGVSVQTFHLFPAIRELDHLLAEDHAWRSRVHEVHPELAFAAMADAADPSPLPYAKKTGLGAYHRLRLLFERFDAAHFEAARTAHRRTDVADDDLADAYACLFSAERIAVGQNARLPDDNAPCDTRGRPMYIAY